MTLEGLKEMGIYASEIAEAVLAEFHTLEQARVEALVQVEELTQKLALETEAKKQMQTEMLVRQQILDAGGKQGKAIFALLEESEVQVDESGNVVVELSRVKAEAPYLFFERETKIDGTGFQGAKKQNNTISSAFKMGLGR